MAREVVERLLDGSADVLTILLGEDADGIDGLRAEIEAAHPEIEIEVHDGGQPHYPLSRRGVARPESGLFHRPALPILPAVENSRPIAVLLVEDNDVFREALELMLAVVAGHPASSGSVGDGESAIERLPRRTVPTSSSWTTACPRLDGVEATAAISESCESAVVVLTATADRAELDALLRGRRRRLPHQGQRAERDRRRDSRRRGPRRVSRLRIRRFVLPLPPA